MAEHTHVLKGFNNARPDAALVLLILLEAFTTSRLLISYH